LILWIRKKSLIQAALLVLSGTALLNALIHLLTGKIDRYLFPGYPLILIIIIILFGQAGKYLAMKYSKKRKKQ
jgi:positive regulator of sigma E activity